MIKCQLGTILGASFYLYWCLPTIIGSFTDRFGGQWFAFIGVLGPCILSAISPLAIDYYQDIALIIIQIMIGGFHGFTYPAWFSLFSKWFYGDERTRANSWMQIGNAIGCSGMYFLAGHLCKLSTIGWHLIFYVMAAIHLPWLALWLWYGSDDPYTNKRISDMELQFIQQQNLEMIKPLSLSKKNKIRTPWLRILISPVVWSSVICKMCCAFGFFLILNKMPSYFAIVFQLTIEQNGLMSALVVFAFGVGSFISPIICNYLIKHFQMSPLLTRKISQNIAMIGPAI
ncbi:Major Facilitator-like protein, partial [Euroglyphus maynei]